AGTRHRQAHCSGTRGNDSRRERAQSRLDVFVYPARFRGGFRVDSRDVSTERPKSQDSLRYNHNPTAQRKNIGIAALEKRRLARVKPTGAPGDLDVRYE